MTTQKLVWRTGAFFTFFWQARHGRHGTRARTFPSRACLALLACFALAFTRLKNAKKQRLQATQKCPQKSSTVRFLILTFVCES